MTMLLTPTSFKDDAFQIMQMFEDLDIQTSPADCALAVATTHREDSSTFAEDSESTIAENEAFERFMTENGHLFGPQHWPVLGKALVADVDTLGASLAAELERAAGQDPDSEKKVQDKTADNADMFFGMAMSLVDGKEDALKDAFQACAARMLSAAATASLDADAQQSLRLALHESQTQVDAKLARLQVSADAIARVRAGSIASVDANLMLAVEAVAADPVCHGRP
ncbi:hypothetical protein BC830DRAFT_774648 [Chytriomyces sp. MP71]|nr:hypothetical protein BC830DRAFT_774648 [Chytriomyces sp. MP71]